jgi:hypothetical protein
VLRGAPCVCFRAVDDESKAAGQVCCSHLEWLFLTFDESPERNEPFPTGMAKDCIDERLDLLAVGFEVTVYLRPLSALHGQLSARVSRFGAGAAAFGTGNFLAR